MFHLESALDPRRNLSMIAHIDAGKTTTTESILFLTGKEGRAGKVDEGTTTTDYLSEEIERGISIVSALVSCEWKGVRLNILDTPGHVDFNGEVEKILRVVEGCVAIFSAVEGVQAQTEALWKQADVYELPRIAFVNKMDRIGANLEKVIEDIREIFSIPPLLFHFPVSEGDQFLGVIDVVRLQWIPFETFPYTPQEIPEKWAIEAQLARDDFFDTLATYLQSPASEQLLQGYLNQEYLSPEAIFEGVREGVLERKCLPVFCGSALNHYGIFELLEGITQLLPSPSHQAYPQVQECGSQKMLSLSGDPAKPFCALLFKIFRHRSGEFLNVIRIYQGSFEAPKVLWNTRTQREEYVTGLWTIYAGEREALERGEAGDILALTGLRESQTGDTLCSQDFLVVFPQKPFPFPVLSLGIEPKNTQDRPVLVKALQQFAKEDPTFHLSMEEELDYCRISGMGELHLEVIANRIQEEFKIEVLLGKPKVLYKETVRGEVKGEFFIRQKWGELWQCGYVFLVLKPDLNMEEILIENHIPEAEVPSSYHLAIIQGVQSAIQSGGLYGYPLTGFKVELTGGKRQEGDSEFGYHKAAKIAFQEALRERKTSILEPLMQVETFCPESFQGRVLGELQSRHAKIVATEFSRDRIKILAEVYLREMFGYANQLRAMTQGRGTYFMKVLRYEVSTSMKAEEN
jgi:elongation factor G